LPKKKHGLSCIDVDPWSCDVAVGDWHEFSDGYRFRETLFGPMTTTVCVDCGDEVLIVQDCGQVNAHGLRENVPTASPRCSGCWRRHHGLDEERS
jgi:hypothetical protein